MTADEFIEFSGIRDKKVSIVQDFKKPEQKCGPVILTATSTYRIHDLLRIAFECGFSEGLIYHENSGIPAESGPIARHDH